MSTLMASSVGASILAFDLESSLTRSCYDRTEYWLSFLKVVTVIVFILVGIVVNAGVNREHTYIGLRNWRIDGAPFHAGFAGFAKVFVTASFACTFSLYSLYSMNSR